MGEEKGKDSEFNWASLFIQSLDQQVSILNRLTLNIALYDQESGKYFYELATAQLLNLFIKLSGHLSKPEKEEGYRLKNILEKIIRYYPIHEINTSYSYKGKNTKKVVNLKNLDIIKDIIFEFQMRIIGWIENHKLGTPESRDVSKAVIRM